MASINFIDYTTVITAEWLNEADNLVHDIFSNPATKADARTSLDVYSKSESDALVDDLSGVTDPATARANLDVYSTAEVDALGVVLDNKAIGNIQNPLLHMPLKNSLGIPIGAGVVTFTRSTIATYVDRYGNIQNAAIDEPRFEKEGLLIEGASTNKALYSADLSNAAYTKSAASITGTIQLVEDGTNATHQVYQAVTLSGAVESTFSVTCKGITRTKVRVSIFNATDGAIGEVYVDLSNGAINGTPIGTSYSVKELADGWYIISVTATGTQTTHNYRVALVDDSWNVTYTGDGTSSAYVTNYQVEELPFASSYIPTTTAAVNRTADGVVLTYNNNFNYEDGFTVLWDAHLNGDLTDTAYQYRAFTLDGVTAVYARYYNSNILVKRANSGAESSLAVTNALHRGGFAWDGAQYTVWLNGIEATPVTPGTAVTGTATQITLGAWSGGAGGHLWGHLSNFRIYDRVLSDNEMRVA